MVRHAPIHRRSGHSDIAICCGRNVLGSSPSTYGGAPLESGHHFESQTIQRIQNVFGRTLSLSRLYASEGRPSIPPEQLLSALLLQVFYGIRSERQLMEQLDYNLLYRWFVGLSPDDLVWDPTVFTKNRDRLQS